MGHYFLDTQYKENEYINRELALFVTNVLDLDSESILSMNSNSNNS